MNNIYFKAINKHRQSGIATLLLVTLIGITIMLASTAVVLMSTARKDVSSASHAQSNAQVMAWAGVSAFNALLSMKANDDLELLNNEVVYVGNKNPSKGIVIDSKSGLIALLDRGDYNNGDIVKKSGEMFKYLRRFTQSDLEILRIYDWKSDIRRIMKSKKRA